MVDSVHGLVRGRAQHCTGAGRTQADPVADTLIHNLLNYADAWKPMTPRSAVYLGDVAGKTAAHSSRLSSRLIAVRQRSVTFFILKVAYSRRRAGSASKRPPVMTKLQTFPIALRH